MPSYPDLGLTSPAQESWQAPKGSSVPIPPPPARGPRASMGLLFVGTSGAPPSMVPLSCGLWVPTAAQEPRPGRIC